MQKDVLIFSQKAQCDASLVPISQASPISFPYASGGTGVTYPFTTFFTFTPISGCILNCNYGDICGPATTLSGTDVLVTNAAYPWEITASNTIIAGYSKTLCLKCTSNNAVAAFENTFTIQQALLDCSALLYPKAQITISIPYLDRGAELSKNYLDFFDETQISGCSVLTCNYGDFCGASTISSPNVSKTSVTPF